MSKRFIPYLLSVICSLFLLPPSAWAQTQKVTRQSQQTVKPAPKKAVSRWKYQGNFYEGLAVVMDDKGEWHRINKQGEIVK